MELKDEDSATPKINSARQRRVVIQEEPDEPSPTRMRVCALRELFPDGIPLARVDGIQPKPADVITWETDTRCRVHPVRETNHTNALTTALDDQSQSSMKLCESHLPQVQMSLEGTLYPPNDSTSGITVTVLLDAGATVSTVDPDIARKLVALGAVKTSSNQKKIEPGDTIF